MRITMDKHSVAHTWANKLQERARTPTGNLYFNYNGIYSYSAHFMIAKHVQNSKGEEAVLITTRKNSKTTNAHVNMVREASRHIKQLYVPDPDQPWDWMIESWYEEIKTIASHLDGARKAEKYVLEIRRVMAEMQTYADFIGLELPEHLIDAGEIQNKEQYAEIVEREIHLREAEEARRKKAQLVIQKKNLKLWRTFARREVRTYDGLDYLRYNPASERVETTQNVEIPAGIARNFYALVLETLSKGGCTDCKTKLMDMYDVLEITEKHIRIGCHTITMKEIKAFTKSMGW
jgi:hypothetical protein